MKLRFCLGLFFISFLQISIGQDLIPLWGVPQKDIDGERTFVRVSLWDNEGINDHTVRLFDEENLKMSDCFENLDQLVFYSKISDDSLLIIHSLRSKYYLNVISADCKQLIDLHHDNEISQDIRYSHLSSIGNKLIGKQPFNNELFFYNKKGALEREVQIANTEPLDDRYFFFETISDSTILYKGKTDSKFYEIDTLGQIVNSFELPVSDSTRINKHKENFYTFEKREPDYQFYYFNNNGDILEQATLKDTCQKCNYHDVIVADDFFYLVGKVKHFYYPESGGLLADPIVSKFDKSGNLIASKMYPDNYHSYLNFGFSNKDSLIVFGNFNDPNRSGLRGEIVTGGYFKTDKDMNELQNLEYFSLDTMVIDTMVIDTMKTDSITNDIDQFKIGPNPVDDKFIIQVPEKDVEYELNFYGIHGRRIENLKFINQTEVEVAYLEHGVYIYQIINLLSGKVHTGKILVYH